MTRRGFSLAEMMVAIGVLGIGLTMVACFFPVALHLHASTTIQQRAMGIAREAKSLVLSLPEPNLVQTLPGTDIYWQLTDRYVDPGVYWLEMISPPADPNSLPVFTSDVRYVWHLLSRREGGVRRYMVAVCRVLPGQKFVSFANWANLGAGPIVPIPMPFGAKWPTWIAFVTVPVPSTPPGPEVKTLTFHDAFRAKEPWKTPGGLEGFCPPGTKLISKRTGLVYTVVSIEPWDTINLREALDPRDVLGGPAEFSSFILFPPAITTPQPYGDAVDWSKAQWTDTSPLVMVMTF